MNLFVNGCCVMVGRPDMRAHMFVAVWLQGLVDHQNDTARLPYSLAPRLNVAANVGLHRCACTSVHKG
jgi:hypothetical protein